MGRNNGKDEGRYCYVSRWGVALRFAGWFCVAKLEGLSFFGTEMIDGVVHVRNKPKGWYRATHVFPTEAALWAAIPKPPKGFTLRQVVNGAFLPIDIGPSQDEVGTYLRQIETLSQ